MRELRRVGKFMIDNKSLELHIVPNMYDCIWHLKALSDIEFANDQETRIIVMDSLYSFVEYLLHGKARA